MAVVPLKILRERAGFTQNEVARLLEVDGQFVSNIERGVAPLPPKHFPRVAALYKVTEESLIRMSVRRYEQRIRRDLDRVRKK